MENDISNRSEVRPITCHGCGTVECFVSGCIIQRLEEENSDAIPVADPQPLSSVAHAGAQSSEESRPPYNRFERGPVIC